MNEPVMGEVAQAKLREQPNGSTAEEDSLPAEAHCRGEQQRCEEKKGDVHGEDVEQRRAIEQKDGTDDGDEGMGEVEVEKIVEGSFVGVDSDCGGDGEGEGEHEQVIAVDFERALPEANA